MALGKEAKQGEAPLSKEKEWWLYISPFESWPVSGKDSDKS